MAWQTIVPSTPADKLEYVTPAISELPKNTEVIIRIDLPFWAPIGKLADLAGAEWWASWLSPAGLVVDDIYGDWRWLEIKGRADPLWLIPLLPLIVKALAALGLAGLLAWLSVSVTANIFVKPEEIVAEREVRRVEYIKWRTSPTGGGATAEQAVKEVEGFAPPPPQAKELFADILPAVGIGAGAGILILLIILFLAGRR